MRMIYGHRINLFKAILDALEGFGIGRTGLTMPTMALWRLNRYANNLGRGSKRRIIYALKNAYIRMLYEQGYCTQAVLETQKLECWHTRAYNDGWDDYCPKCDNTGIYAEYELYRFTFNVDGCWYSWHQPVDLVDFPVQLDVGHNEFWGHVRAPYDEDGYIEGLKGTNPRHDLWSVWWCLLLNGYKVPSLLGLYRKFRPLNYLDRVWGFIRQTSFREGIRLCGGCHKPYALFGHHISCKCDIPF